MNICLKRRSEAVHWIAPEAEIRPAARVFVGFLWVVFLAGCASPGLPLAPSLKLPEIVSANGLEAIRIGNNVTLRWTTPTRTTDKLAIAGPVTVEICREAVGGGAAGNPCAQVAQRLQVVAGASGEAVDRLPPELLSGPSRLLAYRVQLLNEAGRTAGPSPAVYVASGPAPAPVEDLSGRAAKAGAVLEWRPLADAAPAGALTIELERTAMEPKAESATPAGRGKSSDLLAAPKEPTVESLRVGGTGHGLGSAVDSGGTIDRTAEIGHTYRYTVQRVLTVTVGGQTLEVRSAPSSPVTVPMSDRFPPEAPSGLVAVPSFAGEVGGQIAAIDLSWEPNMEPRIAGYKVYRRDLGGDRAGSWRLLTAEVVQMAAYRDLSVTASERYAYRVTAVSGAGIESAPSAEVVAAGPAR